MKLVGHAEWDSGDAVKLIDAALGTGKRRRGRGALRTFVSDFRGGGFEPERPLSFAETKDRQVFPFWTIRYVSICSPNFGTLTRVAASGQG